jgi:Flp pilus assembly protein TadD
VPLFAVSAAVGLVAVWFQENRSIGSGGVMIGSCAVRVALAGQTWVRYLWHSVSPLGLEPVYNRWIQGARGWDYWPWAALTLGTAVLWSRRSTWGRHGILGLGWFTIQLAPVLGFVPISFMRLSWIMDHLAYLALPGLTGLAAAGCGVAARRIPGSWRNGGALLAMGAVAALAFESRTYAAAFKSEETLWSYALRRDPQSWLAQSNLGVVRLVQGRTAEAEAYFLAALKLHPGDPETEYRLGVAQASAGRWSDAIRSYEAVLLQRPQDADVHAQLGAALVSSGRGAEAIPHFQAAAKLRPYDASIRYSLALALRKLGRDDEARAALQEAERLNPRLKEARDLLFRTPNAH